MKVISKLSGRVRWFVSVGRKFRGFKIELMFDNPYAIIRQLVIIEIVLFYVTAWLVIYEKESMR